jgi:hypothetical protein
VIGLRGICRIECCRAGVVLRFHIQATRDDASSVASPQSTRQDIASSRLLPAATVSARHSEHLQDLLRISFALLGCNRIVRDCHARRWHQQAQTSLREPRRRFGLARNSERNFENATKSALPSKLHLVRHILHLPIHITASSFNLLFAPSPRATSHTHIHNAVLKIITDCEYLLPSCRLLNKY